MPDQASVQDEFLQALIKEKTPASVYLISGIRLSGHVAAFDRHVIILESLSGRQMVFKHAISTVMPSTGDRAPQSLPDAAGNLARTSRA